MPERRPKAKVFVDPFFWCHVEYRTGTEQVGEKKLGGAVPSSPASSMGSSLLSLGGERED